MTVNKSNNYTHYKYYFTIFLLTLVGGAIRIAGIDFGLPGTFARPDEELLVAPALMFFTNNFEPEFYNYPALYKYTLHFLFRFAHLILDTSTEIQNPHIGQLLPMEYYYLLNRYLSASFGTFSIPLLYFFISKHFGNKIGLLSSLFLCFCYLHVRDSHFGTTDIATTFWVIFTCGTALNIGKEGKITYYVIAGIGTAFAFTTKYPGILSAFTVLVAHVIRDMPSQLFLAHFWKSLKNIFCQNIFIYVIVIVFFSFLSSPYLFIKYDIFYQDILNLFDTLGLSSKGSISLPHHLKFTLYYGIGWPLYFLAILGICSLFFQCDKQSIIIISFPLFYLFVMGMSPVKYIRYMLPVLPFFCIAAAVFFVKVIERIKKFPKILVVLGYLGLLLFLLYHPIINIFFFDRMATRMDTRIMVSKWIHKNVPSGAKLTIVSAEGSLNMPYDMDKYQKRWVYNRDDGGFVTQGIPIEAGTNYLIVSRHHYFANRSIQYEENQVLKENIQKYCKKVFSVTPYLKGLDKSLAPVYDFSDVFYIPFIPSKYVTNPGPAFTIYQAIGGFSRK